MKKQIIKFITFLSVSSILIFLDQLTKKIAEKELMNKDPKVVIKDIIEFVYTENRGAAFGILQNKQIFFYILTVVVFVVIFYFLYKIDLSVKYIWYFIFLILIFSGALGNFIDRVINKYVVDFIYFKPINFPVFNLADIYITCGAILMFIFTLPFNSVDE